MNWNREFLTRYAPNLDTFRAIFPVCQSTHTGRYGWARTVGAINLNACRFLTEADAVADRDRAFANPDSYPEFSR
jgi:hypothetical protein